MSSQHDSQIQADDNYPYLFNLKVIYHPIIMSLYGVIGYHVTLSEGHMIANHPIYGVIGYHVTHSDCHMIANHPI